MSVLVVYGSLHGRTRRTAAAIADAAAERGVATLIRAADEFEPAHLEANALIAGCWTRSDVPFGGKPTRQLAAWIDRLPPLEGKPVGVFCTYRFFGHTFADTTARTAETLAELSRHFEMKGAKVAATRAINLRSIEQGAAALTVEVLDHVHDG